MRCLISNHLVDYSIFMLLYTESSGICLNFHPIRKPNLVINLLFIQSISKFLTSLPSRRLSLKLWLISRHGFKIEKKKFTFADTPQKVDNILRAICFAYSCIFSVQLFCLRTAVNAIFFLVHSVNEC